MKRSTMLVLTASTAFLFGCGEPQPDPQPPGPPPAAAPPPGALGPLPPPEEDPNDPFGQPQGPN